MIAPHTRTRTSHSPTGHSRTFVAGASAALVCGLSLALVVTGGPARAATDDVDLKTTAQFAVLAGAGISNTGATTIAGDIGSSPTPAITGKSSIVMTSGTIRDTTDDAALVDQAKIDLVTAYDDAAAATPEPPAPLPLPDDLGQQTLKAGVHTRTGAMGLTGTVTLDAEGVPSSVFIIRVSSDVTTATTSRVLLVNGAQPCHVYWQINGSVTFGTGTTFVGNVMALTSITAVTGATFDGRLLARNGAVTLQANTITRSACDVAPPPAATTTPAPVVTTVPPVKSTPKATPKPTKKPSSDKDSIKRDDDDADDGGSGGTSGGGTSGGGTTGGSDGDADGSTTTTSTGIPNTGGPPAFLAPAGAVAVLAGAVLVLVSRRPRGTDRA